MSRVRAALEADFLAELSAQCLQNKDKSNKQISVLPRSNAWVIWENFTAEPSQGGDTLAFQRADGTSRLTWLQLATQ